MKEAKIFPNGQSMAVRLPKEFRVTGKEIYIKKMGHALVLIPIEDNPWDDWEQSLSLFSSDFLDERNQPKPQSREPL